MVLNWKQKYILEISDIESPSIGDDSSLLYLSFVQKKIACSDFLDWAQSETKLPILKSEFFQQFKWKQEILNFRPELKKFWNQILVPLTSWDGHLIVAGAYIPDEFPKENIIFIYSHYNLTEKIWDQISALGAPENNENEEIQLLDIEPDSEFVMSDESDEDKKHLPVNEEDESGDLQISIDAPVELLQKLDFSQVIQPKVLQAPAEEISVIKTKTNIKIEKLSNSRINIPTNSKSSDAKNSSSTNNDLSLEPHTKTNFQIKVNENSFSPLDLDYSEVFNMWQEIQEEMQTYYDKCYFLTINANQAVMPQIWSDNVIVSAQKSPISINQASMFNIVAKTLKPYHGYVVPNEVNDQFFAIWNESSIPDHVTLVPILIKNNLCGYLMGLGPKSAYNKNSLRLVEKLTEQIKMALEKSLAALAS